MSGAPGAGLPRRPAHFCTHLTAMAVALAGIPGAAAAQGLSVDLSAGSVIYEPVSASVRASSVIGTLRYESGEQLWVYGSGGAPLRDGDSSWLSTGAGGRLQGRPSRAMRPGLDVGVHGYLFRDALAAAQGSGAMVEALPFVALPAGPGHVEVRAGWRGHTLSYAGAREGRGLIETGVRTVHGSTLRAALDAKWVYADGRGFPFAGATVTYAGRPVQLWLHAGKWLDDELDEPSWGAGAGLVLTARATLWGRAWQEAPDPLYWNLPRRSWSVGITHSFGPRAVDDRAPLRPPERDGGRVVITLPIADARLPALFIAGDFTGWQPVAMRREGNVWLVRLPVEPGVYRYAFRTADGRWFVPQSVATRRDDGMGGQVAVLVVS